MADRYRNFAALAAHEIRNVDYRIVRKDRNTAAVVLAPHGGWIEPGSSQIARAIARTDFSLYLFEGKERGRPHRDLHITSTRFDEPKCVKLLAAASTAVAIHGRADGGDTDTVWLGGADVCLRRRIGAALKAAGFKASAVHHRLAGRDPNNICNRTLKRAGVQLELPRTLRDGLVAKKSRLRSFANAVRAALSP